MLLGIKTVVGEIPAECSVRQREMSNALVVLEFFNAVDLSIEMIFHADIKKHKSIKSYELEHSGVLGVSNVKQCRARGWYLPGCRMAHPG